MSAYIFLTYIAIIAAIAGIVSLLLAYVKCKPHPSFTMTAMLSLTMNALGLLNQMWTLCVQQNGQWYLKFYVIVAGVLSISFAILACKFPALKDDYFYFFKQFKQIFWRMKQVAIFPESVSDYVDKVDGVQESAPLKKVLNYPNATNGFFMDSDPDGVPCICKQIGDEDTLVIQFKRANETTYLSTSVDFVGGRPPRKPR